jgi:hypothetical protein
MEEPDIKKILLCHVVSTAIVFCNGPFKYQRGTLPATRDKGLFALGHVRGYQVCLLPTGIHQLFHP